MFTLSYKYREDSEWLEDGTYESFDDAFQASRDLLEDGYQVKINEE